MPLSFTPKKSSSASLSFTTRKPSLNSTKGLTALAQQTGLGEQARKITDSKGESPKKIFSGGFVSDVFDTLNVLQYGTAGVIQGKGFAQGVKTRASFADKDQLGQYGWLGTLAGIGLDIATDPLTYAGGLGILKRAGTAIKGTKAVEAAFKVVRESAVGKKLGQIFIYRFGQDPVYKQLAERTITNIGVTNQNLVDLVRPITKLSSKAQRAIADARKAGNLATLSLELQALTKPAFDELDRLGKEAVEAGLLNKKIYDEHVGKYIARLYKSKETIGDKIKNLFSKSRIDLSRFKSRKDIPEDVREAMGEILEAGYPTAKSLIQLNTAVQRAKFFGEVAAKWGTDVVQDGLKLLPNTPSLGKLAGKYVPETIFDDLTELTRPIDPSIGSKLMAGFKFGKVVMNPATHIRNVMSNFVLNNFEGLNPARLDIYATAASELAKKGKWYQEAKQVGLGLDTYAAREIKQILTGTEVQSKLGSLWHGTVDKLSALYQKEEEFAKLAQYIFQRKGGKTAEEAWQIAERATFNYAQVTPFIRRLRESVFGYPFVTFTYKATPQVVKTLLTKPTKISNIGKIKTAIEQRSDQQELSKERATEPSWFKDGFYVKLPIKDKLGRSAYFDLTYVLPFGDLVSGNLFERGINRETGLPESVPTSLIQKSPLLNLVREISNNQDFYGNRIWKDSDPSEKQLGDLMRHLVKTYTPPLVSDQIPGGYTYKNTHRPGGISSAIQTSQGNPPTSSSRTLFQEFLRNVGAKISPVDLEVQEQFFEGDIRKALERLLIENNQGAEFKRFYVPKN